MRKSCQANQAYTLGYGLTRTPWNHIHVDFTGPYLGHTFFIVVDVHSKWPEVEMMSTTTSEKATEVLRSLFAHHGLSEQLVSNNGPQFTSAEFKQFLESKRIKHILFEYYVTTHVTTNAAPCELFLK